MEDDSPLREFMTKRISRRQAISTTAKVVAGIVAAAAIGGVGAATYLTRPKPAEEVTFDLAFLSGAGDVIWVVGKEKGFFSDQGIDLNLAASQSGTTAIQLLGTGKNQFVFPDISQVILGRASGIPVKSISIVRHIPGYSIITESPLSSPKQLEGMTIGSTPGNSTQLVFPAFASAVGIDASKVKWVDVPFSAVLPSLEKGQFDAIGVFGENAAGYSVTTGKPFYSMIYGDYANLGYGTVVASSDAFIRERPDLVSGFVKGTWVSADWCYNNPDEAVSIYVKALPENDLNSTTAEFKALMKDFYNAGDGSGKTGIAHGFGSFDVIGKNLEIAQNYLSSPAQLPLLKTMTPQDVHTNQFVS